MTRKLLLTKYKEIDLAVIVEDGKIVEIHPKRMIPAPCVGEIYTGTVKKMVPSQNAAYLDIGFLEPVYMSLHGKYIDSDTGETVRPGMQIRVQVKKEATGLKKAVVKKCTQTVNEKEPFGIQYAKDVEEIVTDSEDTFNELSRYCSADIRLYPDDVISLPGLYGIPSCIEDIYKKKIWLKCGGFLVIEPTEALTVIDVNSGKYIHGKDKEAAVYKVNLEAAKEIAAQLRLRNISGIILVDFINMKDKERKEEYLEVFREELKKDPIPAQFIDETALQLVELTRKREEPPLSESLRKSDISIKH